MYRIKNLVYFVQRRRRRWLFTHQLSDIWYAAMFVHGSHLHTHTNTYTETNDWPTCLLIFRWFWCSNTAHLLARFLIACCRRCRWHCRRKKVTHHIKLCCCVEFLLMLCAAHNCQCTNTKKTHKLPTTKRSQLFNWIQFCCHCWTSGILNCGIFLLCVCVLSLDLLFRSNSLISFLLLVDFITAIHMRFL